MASEPATTLATVFKGWDRYQDLLVQTVQPLSAEQLAWRPAPHLRSADELVAHIIGARSAWLSLVLRQDDPGLVELNPWDEPGAPERSAQELVSGLLLTWQVIRSGLERWTVADFDTVFSYEENGVTEEYTRHWVLWHLIEHDMHHGGRAGYAWAGRHGHLRAEADA